MVRPAAAAFAAAMLVAAGAAGLAETASQPGAAGTPSAAGGAAPRTTDGESSRAAGQAGQGAGQNQPPPLSRNKNDCNKTNCVDNGGG